MNDRLRVLKRQPRRISITLSFHVHEALLKRSEEEGRSVSNLCAFLLEDSLNQQGKLQPMEKLQQGVLSQDGRYQASSPDGRYRHAGDGHRVAPGRSEWRKE